MQEAFLHYVWKHRKWDTPGLRLVSGEALSVIHPGHANRLAGPDFLDARIRIDETLWAGQVEIHINASDWYAHRHEGDPAYHNVILHVVWNDNMPVLNKDGRPIPTLEVCHTFSHTIYSHYQKLIHRRAAFIPCEKSIASVDQLVLNRWLERLYIDRLQKRALAILELKNDRGGHWEAAFFILLAQGFGTRINKETFRDMAMRIPFRVLSRVRRDATSLEALFMGMTGILEIEDATDPYLISQRREFDFLVKKYELNRFPQLRPHYFKLRPHNFPTIRLSQLAQLYHRSPNLLSACIGSGGLVEHYDVFRTAASSYWDAHYVFGKSSAAKPKVTSNHFIDMLLINVVLPVKYAYARDRGDDAWETVADLIQQIRPERNSITEAYRGLGIRATSAMETQALLELHSGYCTAKRCLDCAIGHRLLGRM